MDDVEKDIEDDVAREVQNLSRVRLEKAEVEMEAKIGRGWVGPPR